MLRAVIFDMGDTLMEEADESQLPVDQVPVTLLPGAVEVLEELSQHYILGGITNTNMSTEEEVLRALEKLGLAAYFEAVVSSFDLGVSKPEPGIFLDLLSRLGVEPGEAVMVGDRLDADIKGAKALGMRTIWFRWNEKYRGEPEDDKEEPDVRITSLDQVVGAVKELERSLSVDF